MARILIFDLETSDLRSDWGFTICAGYKWLDERRIYCPSIMDYPDWHEDITDDSRLIKDVHKVMNEADMLVSFYGKGFDLKWFNTKFLQHGLDVLPNHPHVDLFYTAKGNLNLSRKSLDNISKFLQLPQKKYHVQPEIWRKARVGVPKALEQVIEHCKRDVLITEKLYHRLKPLIRQHPRVAGWQPCRVCGSTSLQKRGYAVTTTMGRKIRIQCQGCGAWENRSEEHAEVAS